MERFFQLDWDYYEYFNDKKLSFILIEMRL